MTVTRTRLDQCSTKDCPFTREEHDDWMERCANGAEHGHRHDQPTHAHFPKKGMGGNNPAAKIVAIICWPLHDATDNGLNGMGVALGEVRFWDVHNNTILRGPVGASSDGGEVRAASGTRGLEPPALPLSPDASVGASTAEGEQWEIPSVQVRPAVAGTNDSAAPSLSAAGASAPEQEPPAVDARGDSWNVVRSHLSPVAATPSSVQPVTFHENGLEVEPEITFMEWVTAAERVSKENIGRQWRAGDLYNAGDDRWSESHQYLDELGYPNETLSNYANVAKAFALHQRAPLPFTYHQSVWKHPDRHELLEQCLANDWDRAQLREAAYGPKPERARKFTLEELRERLASWDYQGTEHGEDDVTAFLDWLAQ